MGDNTLTIIELILPKSLKKVHDFAMLSLFVDNNTKQWLNKKSRHFGTIKLNLKTYNGKPTNTKPNPTSKTKTSYKHLHAMHFFLCNAKAKQKTLEVKMTSYSPWLSLVCSILQLSIESIHVLSFCQTF
jgi:hypothetical protein